MLTALSLGIDERVGSQVNLLLFDNLLLPGKLEPLDFRICELVQIEIGGLVANGVGWGRDNTLLALTEESQVLELLLFVYFGLIKRLLEEKGIYNLGTIREGRGGEAASVVVAGVIGLFFGLARRWCLEVAREDVG